jgi:hypothetical protein
VSRADSAAGTGLDALRTGRRSHAHRLLPWGRQRRSRVYFPFDTPIVDLNVMLHQKVGNQAAVIPTDVLPENWSRDNERLGRKERVMRKGAWHFSDDLRSREQCSSARRCLANLRGSPRQRSLAAERPTPRRPRILDRHHGEVGPTAVTRGVASSGGISRRARIRIHTEAQDYRGASRHPLRRARGPAGTRARYSRDLSRRWRALRHGQRDPRQTRTLP